MIDKSTYKLFTDKVVYKPTGITAEKALENAGAISAFEKLPVELYYDNMVMRVKIAKIEIERIR